jgi:hypothetical protein
MSKVNEQKTKIVDKTAGKEAEGMVAHALKQANPAAAFGEAVIARIGAFIGARPALAVVLTFLFAAAVFAAVIWYFLFSGFTEPAGFIYNEF